VDAILEEEGLGLGVGYDCGGFEVGVLEGVDAEEDGVVVDISPLEEIHITFELL